MSDMVGMATTNGERPWSNSQSPPESLCGTTNVQERFLQGGKVNELWMDVALLSDVAAVSAIHILAANDGNWGVARISRRQIGYGYYEA